jgi:hypothetical protein
MGTTLMGSAHKVDFLPNLVSMGHRKTAEGAPLTIMEKIREFIVQNKPNITADPSAIIAAAKRVKMPLLAVAGVAFIAGVSFLAYKLYKHWSEGKANETIAKIMKDIEASTPDLLRMDGWREQIHQEVSDAVHAGSPEEMTKRITEIKTAVIEKQRSSGKAVGAGIDLFREGAVEKVGMFPIPSYQQVRHEGGRAKPFAGRGYGSPL